MFGNSRGEYASKAKIKLIHLTMNLIKIKLIKYCVSLKLKIGESQSMYTNLFHGIERYGNGIMSKRHSEIGDGCAFLLRTKKNSVRFDVGHKHHRQI